MSIENGKEEKQGVTLLEMIEIMEEFTPIMAVVLAWDARRKMAEAWNAFARAEQAKQLQKGLEKLEDEK